MKKITNKLALCLALTLAFAACGKESTTTSSSSNQETKPQETKPKDDATNKGSDGKTDNDQDTGCKPGFFGPDCRPCTCQHGVCNDGKEGDGKCSSCNLGWDGDDCNQCADGFTDENCDQCKKGFFGENCTACTCVNGICQEGKDGDGECSSCEEGYFGKNCDSNKITCVNGTPSIGPSGNGHCLQCEGNYWGADCDTCPSPYEGDNCDKIQEVNINGQIWMAANMSGTTGNDGSTITCYAKPLTYIDLVPINGCLYTWEDAMKVCPQGWHLPTRTEFEVLRTYVGGDNSTGSEALRDQSFYGGTGRHGFKARAAGYYDSGNYLGLSEYAGFWSSTEGRDSEAYRMGIAYYHVGLASEDKTRGFSVRCLKD